MATTTEAGPPPATPAAAPLRPRSAAISAVLAVAAALGVGDLVAALASPSSSPFVAVGQGFIRITPEWLKALAIAWFGTADKIALLVGMALVIGGLAVVAGLASRRGPGPGTALVLAMGAVGVFAVVVAPTFSPADLLAPLAAVVVGVGAWLLLHRSAAAAAAEDGATGGDPETGETGGDRAGAARRRFLLTGIGVAAGAGAAAAIGRGTASAEPVPTVLPPAAPAPPRPPARVDFVADGSVPWQTPNADFYRIDTALSVPRLSTEGWSLRVHGMVDRELQVTWEDLVSRPLVEVPVTLTCVSNEVGGPLISNAVWRGVPVSELLAEAGVRPGAEQILSTSSDGWNCNTPLGPLTDGRPALLAIGMNGEPLPVEHGFPVRMVVSGLYGYVSACKWITDIEVTTFDAVTSYWEQRDWAQFAPIKTQSRIDVPRAGASVPAGPVTVAGVAWAQHTGIDAVQVAVDGGTWRDAELADEPTVDSWRMWRLRTELAPGSHTLAVRARDRSGETQTSQVAPVLPDGATGWHTVDVTAA